MVTLLYDDRYAPITSEIEFLECDAKTAAEEFQVWQSGIHSARGGSLARREVLGDFATKIESLLPLTAGERCRSLFLPTASKWCAYLDSGWRGTDVSAVSHLGRVMHIRAIRAVCIPHTIRKDRGLEVGRSGATIFELYAADSDGCSFLNMRRSVSAVYDGRWTFDATGEPPLKFERVEKYSARHVRDRFTPEMLDEYLRNFGIQFFSPSFYEMAQPAHLIEKVGIPVASVKEYTLEKARAAF